MFKIRNLLIILLMPTIAHASVNKFDLLKGNRLDVDNVRIDGNTVSTTNSNGDLTFDANGTGSLILTDLSADTALYLDASKKVKSSSVTTTQLGYVATATSNICGISQSCTLTNKTLSGSSNTFTDIPLLTAVTGVLPGANGGTGMDTTLSSGLLKFTIGTPSVVQVSNADVAAAAGIGVTKLEALTASRPVITDGSGFLTTESALAISRGGSGQTTANDALNAFLPSQGGNGGKFLTTDGTNSSWATASGGGSTALAVTSKTTTYTATNSDDVILASGSAFTVTLYAAAGNSGRVLRIKKTDSSLSNIITIDGNSSETIDGALTTTLNTQYEEVALLCDGSNWHILNRSYPSVYVAYTPTFTGFGTVSAVSFYSKRVADELVFHGTFTCGTSTAVQAQITLGFNGTNANVTAANNTKLTTGGNVMGSGFYSAANTVSAVVIPAPGLGHFYVGVQSATTAGFAGANGNTICSSGQTLSIYGRVPISGWN